MADVHEPEVRSYNMSRIRAKNSKPELIVRKYLHSKGFRFRVHVKKYPGTPDIVLPKYNAIVLVNGCFWHGHEGCKKFVWPKTREEFWRNKIEGNIRKDKNNQLKLQEMGWRVFTIWECELKKDLRNLTLTSLDYSLREIKI